MKAHNGMRPHDIVVLLKIILLKDNWMNKDLSASLYISPSEISESLNRSMIVKLLSSDKRKVMKNALLRFIENGLPFVFPAEPGAISRGIPTAHSSPFLEQFFSSEEVYIWPDFNGNAKGQIVTPLYPNQTKAAKDDEHLYELLTLIDAIRIGKVRESQKAIELLKTRIKA